MAKRRPHKPPGGKNRRPNRGPNRQGPRSVLKVRSLPDKRGWELVSPPCAAEREEDLEEVREMIEAGEAEIATDELRYLLSGCPEMLAAHVLLGQLAVEDENREADVELARGHFGYAFQLGEKAIQAYQCPGPFLAVEPGNGPWYEAARGLAWCFEKQGNAPMADQIATTAKRFDPSDPAEIIAMLDELRAGGLPIVELG